MKNFTVWDEYTTDELRDVAKSVPALTLSISRIIESREANQ